MVLVVKVGATLVGANSILKMFITYLKQYKIPFNAPFQHLKSMVSLCKQFWWTTFTKKFDFGY